MKITRNYDWPERLAEYLESMAGVPFELGVNDCGTFALGAVKAMTGLDLVSELGTYEDGQSEQAALMLLVTKYEVKECRVLMAQRGDICLYISSEGPTALVVDMNGTHAVGPGATNPVTVPVRSCVKAWRIGG